MTSERSSVTVRIAGEDHTIRASAEPEYTRKCAKLVDDRIHDIRVAAGLIEGNKAAILAALSIADELFQAQDQRDRSVGEIMERLGRLTAELEGVLPPQ